MANIPELLDGHVTLEVECLDRLYLNGYIGGLATPGGSIVSLFSCLSFGVHYRPSGVMQNLPFVRQQEARSCLHKGLTDVLYSVGSGGVRLNRR